MQFVCLFFGSSELRIQNYDTITPMHVLLYCFCKDNKPDSSIAGFLDFIRREKFLITRRHSVLETGSVSVYR
jgi:hypothetical protein